MKKVLFATVLLFTAFVSCANTPKKETKATEKNNKVLTENKETKVMEPIHLTKEEFLTKVANYESNPNEWKYLGDKPALIDFYADWCGPCKAIAPVQDELAAEYGGRIYIYKINTETEPELASAFGIRSIPSLLFVPMTGQPQMGAGALPKQQLKEAIDNLLLKE